MSEDIVRQEEEFGKDLGLIHEVIVTGQKAGATKEFWAKLAHDESIFRLVVSQVMPAETDWLETILSRECACHTAFFGKEFDLTLFAETLKGYGESKIRFWQNLGLEPHFLPKVSMMPDEEYPGWKIKPHKWFYENVAKGRIFRDINGELIKLGTVELEGIAALIDTRLKPSYDGGRQMYKKDNLLGPIIKNLREREEKIQKYEYGPQSSRFGVSADEWKKIKPIFAAKIGLGADEGFLEPAIVANVVPQLYSYMPHARDGETNTWVWYEEYFEDRGCRLVGGYSGHGGLAFVNWYYSDFRWDLRSVRPLAVI